MAKGKSAIDIYYKKTGFERHKVFFSALFTCLILIGVLVSYSAVQQQQVFKTRASTGSTILPPPNEDVTGFRTGGGLGSKGLIIRPSPAKIPPNALQRNQGDVVKDGVVDSRDLAVVRNVISLPLNARNDPANLALADINFDGIVDSQDYGLVISSLQSAVGLFKSE